MRSRRSVGAVRERAKCDAAPVVNLHQDRVMAGRTWRLSSGSALGRGSYTRLNRRDETWLVSHSWGEATMSSSHQLTKQRFTRLHNHLRHLYVRPLEAGHDAVGQ
jgi:hypothetical protein